MDIKLLSKKEDRMSFSINKTDNVFVNTLRRMIMDEVPTMAIEDVEFKKNDSVLYDEVVAHRLGLIPLKTDLKNYSFPDPTQKGEISAATHVTFTLKTKASGMIETSKMKSNDPKVVPVYENIPITYLEGEQELEFTALAHLGRGKEHIKWSPAHVWFTEQPIVTVNNNSSKLESFKDKYPSQIFDSSGKINKDLISKNPSLVDACEGVCDDIIKIEHNPDNFILYLESWGQLAPKEIVDRAVFEFLEKIEAFKTLISNL